MKITVQYLDGCPHWKLADRRLANVLQGLDRHEIALEHQLIDSPEMAERIGFRGSPTILVDGRDPFATGTEPMARQPRRSYVKCSREGVGLRNRGRPSGPPSIYQPSRGTVLSLVLAIRTSVPSRITTIGMCRHESSERRA